MGIFILPVIHVTKGAGPKLALSNLKDTMRTLLFRIGEVLHLRTKLLLEFKLLETLVNDEGKSHNDYNDHGHNDDTTIDHDEALLTPPRLEKQRKHQDEAETHIEPDLQRVVQREKVGSE